MTSRDGDIDRVAMGLTCGEVMVVGENGFIIGGVTSEGGSSAI